MLTEKEVDVVKQNIRKSTLDKGLSNCDALGSAIASSIFLPDFTAALLV